MCIIAYYFLNISCYFWVCPVQVPVDGHLALGPLTSSCWSYYGAHLRGLSFCSPLCLSCTCTYRDFWCESDIYVLHKHLSIYKRKVNLDIFILGSWFRTYKYVVSVPGLNLCLWQVAEAVANFWTALKLVTYECILLLYVNMKMM